ncbi:MAG: DUF927 domain-containing protein, partial [Alphaproteobacteria bacterium]|nr:DUF927 domain-containing protein [Alphaproteobacteria bacterium]
MSGAVVLNTPLVVLPRGYVLNKRGLFYQPSTSETGSAPDQVFVCAAFDILARTSDDAHQNHGLLLQWCDRDGEGHTWAMPRRLVHADGNAIAAELENAGLSCGTSRPQHELLKRFLGAVDVKRHVRCVDRAGWHGPVYVLPDGRTFGATADDIVLQTERALKSDAYAERGTMDEWRCNVARHAVGNDLLALAISGAFAGPLLDVLGEQSRGGHFHGGSQIGKTTLARCAISVYGPAETNNVGSWRATANGLEAVAAQASDGLLILDEIKQADAREVDQVIYMLGNNAGKQRATRAGGARPQHTWHIFYFSTGELTVAAKLAEANLRPFAGQEVRLIELSADAGARMGVWQKLHGYSSGAALTDHLRAAARTYCGTAGPAYLDQLARDRADDPGALAATLRAARDKFLTDHVPKGAVGQVQSVAGWFALNGGAGELATAYEVTGWPEGEAMRAAAACFKRWLAARGGSGAAEDAQAVAAVRAFIAAHGASRFTDEDAPKDHLTINRAGFRRS